MLALQGYYDGTTVQTLEKITAKKNQKLIITILDEFMEETPRTDRSSAKGALSKYANTDLWKVEKNAWEEAAGEKHDHT